MQYIENVFRATYLIEPIVYQCGSAGKRVVSHTGLRAGEPSDGKEVWESEFDMSHHSDPATGLQLGDVDPCGTATRPAE